MLWDVKEGANSYYESGGGGFLEEAVVRQNLNDALIISDERELIYPSVTERSGSRAPLLWCTLEIPGHLVRNTHS